MQWISLFFYFFVFTVLFSLINAIKICKEESKFYIHRSKLRMVFCAVRDGLDKADVVEIVFLSGSLSYVFSKYGSSFEIASFVFLSSLSISCLSALLIIISTGVKSAVFVGKDGDVKVISGRPEEEGDYRLLVWKAKALACEDGIKGVVIFWSYVKRQGVMFTLANERDGHGLKEVLNLSAT